MVSSVFVLLIRDAGELGTSTTEAGEVVKSMLGRDVAAGVGKEDIFSVKVKLSTGHLVGSYIVGN